MIDINGPITEKIIGWWMSCKNGFDTEEVESAKMVATNEHSGEKNSQLSDNKDSKNTTKSSKGIKSFNFKAYSLGETHPKSSVFRALKIFWINNKSVIEFASCLI